MRVSIVIPIYHANELHADFTRQTLESLQSSEHELAVYLIVNYAPPEFYPHKENYKLHESIKDLQTVNNLGGNQVSAAWNFGIRMGLEKAKYVLVANNDLVFHYKAIDNLIKFAEEHPEFILWSASEWIDIRTISGLKEADLEDRWDEHPHFSCFLVSQKTVDVVGFFDEKLQMAYHEDGDYHYRIVLSGNKAAQTYNSRFYHYGSRTIKVDEELNLKNKRTYEANREYIGKKWGVDFHNKVFNPPEEALKEGFKYPFDDPTKNWKDW